MYGIIGNPLTHSWSSAYFQRKFEQLGIQESYEKFQMNSIDEFPALLKNYPQLKGLNVTIPFKEKILPFLDFLSPETKSIQAINCIAIQEGKLTGHNTDIKGFEISLNKLLPAHFHSNALILGTGGASKAVAYVLAKKKIPCSFVSRKPLIKNLTYSQVDAALLRSHTLIINTTPLGMFPETNQCPDIPYTALTTQHFLFDLIYNPKETLFLKRGRQQGATTKNGLEMLMGQAEESWRIWTTR